MHWQFQRKINWRIICKTFQNCNKYKFKVLLIPLKLFCCCYLLVKIHYFFTLWTLFFVSFYWKNYIIYSDHSFLSLTPPKSSQAPHPPNSTPFISPSLSAIWYKFMPSENDHKLWTISWKLLVCSQMTNILCLLQILSL